MALEKYFHKEGNLRWVRGPAREIFRDETLDNSASGYYRICGEGNHWFKLLMPRHLARPELGDASEESLLDVVANLPGIEQWTFVLINHVGLWGESAERFSVAHEITGDTVLDAVVLDGLINLPATSWDELNEAVTSMREELYRQFFPAEN